MFQGPTNTFGTYTWFSTQGPSHTVACLPLGPPTSPSLFHGLYTTGPCQGQPSLRGKNTAGLLRTLVPM
ncbi:hypothetical protein EV363DRAFT_1182017 [Boletus edulis]|nr:hypothetical protein EV363DRAFT_1182017 [Boletus edulis]